MLVAAQLLAHALEQPAALAVQRREDHRQLELGRAHRELLARLALGGVRLVDDPVPDRRQDPAHRHDVAEEQRVVRHDDVRTRGAPAYAVQVAQVRVVAAALARAVGLTGLHRPAHVASPVQVHAVQVAPGALARPRQQHRRRGDLVAIGAVLELAREPLELAQAQVVVVALERHVAQLAAERFVQPRQLVVDELVHQRVGLGRHAHAHPVLRREQRRGHEVGHGLAHAGAGLDREVRAGVERGQDRARHLDLLGALLEARVHLARKPACRELDGDLLGAADTRTRPRRRRASPRPCRRPHVCAGPPSGRRGRAPRLPRCARSTRAPATSPPAPGSRCARARRGPDRRCPRAPLATRRTAPPRRRGPGAPQRRPSALAASGANAAPRSASR